MDCVKHMSQVSTHLPICLFLAQIEKFPPKNLLGLKTAAEALMINTWGLSIFTIPLVYLTNFGQNAIKMEIESSPSFVSMERKLNIMNPPGAATTASYYALILFMQEMK